jgi:predicted nucleic acid-binding protein
VPRTPLLLDACTAINLAATDHLQAIAENINDTFILVQQAAAEVGYLRDIAGGKLTLTPIDQSLYTGDTLEVTDLTPPEYPIYLHLARTVDDGEAATIAVAVQRGLQLATDDRKARRVCAELGIPDPQRTLALLHSFANTAGLQQSQLRDLFVKLRDRASFQPPRSDPDRKWWEDHIGGP